jgi:glycosyltransferase involved in cell wall biosynthesis
MRDKIDPDVLTMPSAYTPTSELNTRASALPGTQEPELRTQDSALSTQSSSSVLRIVRVIDRLNIGGPAKHVVWLSSGLETAEFESTLITGTVPPGEGDMSYFASDNGVEPIVVKQMSRELGARDLLVIAKLARLFFRLRPDVVHTHKAKAGAAGRVAAMIYKWATPSALLLRPRSCRVVHTYHGHIFHSYYGRAKTRLFVAIERALARFCTDRIVVISEQQRREICEAFGVGRSEQFRVIPLGIDIAEEAAPVAPAEFRREIGASPDDVLVGIVGRLCEVKNHSMFLEAAARLIQETSLTNVRFVVIGDGHLRSRLEERASALGVSDRVLFTGFRADVQTLYSELDIVALTSLNEGTPLTLIEAMNRGVPVVSTEVGGVPDIMGAHIETHEGFSAWDHGLTARTLDVEGFAAAVRYLVERDDLRREMGERGRQFVRDHLSRERLVSDITELYRDLSGRPNVASSKNRAVFDVVGE